MNKLNVVLVTLFSCHAMAAEAPIEVGLGREKVISVPGMKRIAVGEGWLVDAKTIGTEQVLLKGQELGETTLRVETKTGEKTFLVKVVNQSLQEEILKILSAQAAAWNRGDLRTFVAAYAPDAVFVSPSGVTRGRDQVLDRYQKKYPDAKAMGKLTLEPTDVRATGDAVSVAAKWTLAYADKPASTGHTVIVFMQVTNEWRIVHDASM